MICPNCGYDQQTGNVCGECQTFIKAVSAPVSQGVEPGWKEAKIPPEAAGQQEDGESGPTDHKGESLEKMKEESSPSVQEFKEVEDHGERGDTTQQESLTPKRSRKQKPVAVAT